MKITKNEVYLNVDSMIKNVKNLNEVEFLYCKAITHIFLSNIGYEKCYKASTLNELKDKFNLKYNKINFIYKGNNYKINYSNKSCKHGKVIGFSYCDNLYNRPLIESFNEYDILFDLRHLKNLDYSIFEEGIDYFDFKNKYDDIKKYRTFLEDSYVLDIKEVICDFLTSEYVSAQKKILPWNNDILKSFYSSGFKVKSSLIENEKIIVSGNFILDDFRVCLKFLNVTDKDADYSMEFVYRYSEWLLNFYIKLFVVESLDSFYGRKIKINTHFVY